MDRNNEDNLSIDESGKTFNPDPLLSELKVNLENDNYSKALGICQRLTRQAQREVAQADLVREVVREELVCIDAHLATIYTTQPLEESSVIESQVVDADSKPSSLIKFSKKLITEYSFELSSFPNIYLAHLHSRFRWLLYSRMTAKTKTTENWDTLIEYALKEHPELARTGIQQLLKYKDLKGIYQFFGKEIGDKYQNQIALDVESKEVESNEEIPLVTYYCKPKDVEITFVADERTLGECQTNVLHSSVTRVGLDCEWRPLSFSDTTRCALIQIGTANHIYLLDGINLPRDLVTQFLVALFGSKEIIKYGYDFSSDISILCQTYPEIEGKTLSQYVNLARPQPLIVKLLTSTGTGTGLAALVKSVLKCDLDKKFQISDWERRPLLDDQMLYAANDAYCLLDLANGLNGIIEDVTTEVSALLKKSIEPTTITLTMKREKPKRSSANKLIVRPQPASDNGSKQSVSEVHTLIDPNLPKLARKLRLCGIDALVPLSSNTQSILNLITSKESPRIFFTKTKALFNALSSHLQNVQTNPETGESTFDTVGLHLLQSNTTLEQVTEIVEKMSIRVTVKDLLSRCTVCNSNRWIGRTSKEIQERQNFGGVRYHEFVRNSSAELESTENSSHIKRKDWIPETICETVERFIECEECNKIYWIGGHAKRVIKGMEGILDTST
ncbi:Exonuclease mut-7 [Basidiobolus ranarum]|uniref:Exonuclease mut-7 n=1 Tax=Basidiobolus ranarum TaxID=34480 RepID=A0ABR2WZL4_9FUNG